MQERLRLPTAAALLASVAVSCGGSNPGRNDSDAKVHLPEVVAATFQDQGLELLRMLDLPTGYGLETVFLPASDESDDPTFAVYVFRTAESMKKFLADKELVPQARPPDVGTMIEQDNVLVLEGSEIPDDDAAAIDEALATLGKDP